MHRLEVINTLITKYNLNNYLEIGVNDGQVFDKIKAKYKLGVDPDCDTYKIDWKGTGAMFCDTSDNFFDQLNEHIKFDIIFIDGLHIADQVFRDIKNSIKHLSKNGYIVLHDCNPPTEHNASPEIHYGSWNGTVYLGYLDAVKTFNLEYYTVNTDFGCGILVPRNIDINKERETNINNWLEFDNNRDKLLNLISVDEFIEKNKIKKVSFVCTTYRRFYCVKRIVSQYKAQTYPNIELIIFNTDEEHPYELGFDDNNIIIINNGINYETGLPYENRGQICRDAVTHATGDYFMLADDDDIYLPWHIQQAVDGIEELGTDAWKPENSFFATQDKIMLCMNTLEASVIIKINRIREIGFRSDITGYEGLSWYSKLRDEKQLDEHNKNYLPSYCFNWGDPGEIAGHKQSGDINNPDNFENHKKATNDYVNDLLTPLDKNELEIFYKKYFDYIETNIDTFNQEYVNRYFKNYLK